MLDLPRLTATQQSVVRSWLPEAELVDDLSWELMGTTVLHLRAPDGEVIVKAGGPGNHHIDREIHAHQQFTKPWVECGVAARMLRHDLDRKVLLLDFLPGSLVQGAAAEWAPDTYRQAGAMLAELHSQGARPDDGYEARMTRKALASLDDPHRIAPETVEHRRELLLADAPQPVTLVPTHGDWQPRNWLIDGGSIRAIDLGRADWRPAFTDFARLAVRQFAADPALETAFLDGYGPDPRTPNCWRILLIREAIGTAVWAYKVGDEKFEMEGHRMIEDAIGGNRKWEIAVSNLHDLGSGTSEWGTER
jgi:hypothetical protein